MTKTFFSAVALPVPEFRERVYVGHGNHEVYDYYTAEQMRDREAAVIAACATRCEDQAKRWTDSRAVYVAHECAAALRDSQPSEQTR